MRRKRPAAASLPHGRTRPGRRTWAEALEPRLALVSPLAITELMYNPPPPSGGPYSSGDFEFIEVQNTSGAPLNVKDYKFSAGVAFTLPDVTLATGEHAVVVKTLAAFVSRYGNGPHVLGAYTGGLSKNGEEIRLDNPATTAILDFTYDNKWIALTDGLGFSLVINDPLGAAASWNNKSSWHASQFHNGNPGAADGGVPEGAIVINELLSHTDLPDGDWIELKNTTDNPINIGGWLMGDGITDHDRSKYIIHAGTIVPAHGFVTFTQFVTFGNAADPGTVVPFQFYELGEQLSLASPDPDPTVTFGGFQISQSFPASDREVTFGRHIKPSGTADFVPMAQETFGSENSYPLIGPVVLNEIMFQPAAGGDTFVELHNITGSAVPLFDAARPTDTWKLRDTAWSYPVPAAGIDYTFPQGITLPADGYALLVQINPATFRGKYGIPDSVPILGPFGGALGTTKADLFLMKPGDPQDHPADPDFGVVPYYEVDHVKYNDSVNWPTSPEGGGPSLSRIDGNLYANTSTNWDAGASGGTPGAVNDVYGISIDNVAIAEGNAGTTPAVFTVSLTVPPSHQVTVQYSTADESATAGSDYIGGSGTLTFGIGVASIPLTVSLNGDTTFEPNESFAVDLSNPSGAKILSGQAHGTIINDDSVPTLSIDDVSLPEGDSGTSNVVFTVSLSAASTQQVKVAFATADGAASAGADYTQTSGTLTFNPSDVSKTITVAVKGDALNEADETFFVNLTSPTNATIADGQGVGTIIDNDPQPSLSIADVTLPEGNSGATNFVFAVNLSVASGKTITVTFATANGTASASGDYSTTSGTLTFNPGITTQNATVAVNGDTAVEPNETFFVNLSAAVNATIADAQAVGAITNDDAAAPWQNPNNHLDVTGDGNVFASDALQVINAINATGPRDLPPPSAGNTPPPFIDTSGDNKLSALDVLLVINDINARTALVAQQLAIGLAFSRASAASHGESSQQMRAFALDGVGQEPSHELESILNDLAAGR